MNSKDMKLKMERLRELKQMKTMPMQVPLRRMRMNPTDSFDKIVAKMDTIHLTRNTISLTNLPDEFEPSFQDDADSIAKSIP